MQFIQTSLASAATVYSFIGPQSSHLLASGGCAVLIDCHDPLLHQKIADAGLPLPTQILHTHIQPEHCREGFSFGDTPIHVHAPDALLAFHPGAVMARAKMQKADLNAWPSLLGKEPFGIGGCQMDFPPAEKLPMGHSFEIGAVFSCGNVTLEVIGLPFHKEHAVGFVVRDSDKTICAIFSGDLFHDGPFLVDAFSLAANYGQTRLNDFPVLASRLLEFGNVPFFPASGPPIREAAGQIKSLAEKIERLSNIKAPALPAPIAGQQPLRRAGRFREIEKGVFNLVNFGNVIVFISDDGSGLLVDPGPCDYENPDRETDFLDDLHALETEAGLRQIDLVLLTHFHGDHIDMLLLVRARYRHCKVATWSMVADVVKHPDRFSYSCLLPWYNVGVDSMKVDIRADLHSTLDWQGRQIRVIHLPGHAYVHCGFLFSFNGRNIAVTGDTVQGYGQPDEGQLIITNRAAPVSGEGPLDAYRELARHRIDLNLGGHGSWFYETAPVYAASISLIERRYAALAEIFRPGMLRKAFIPAWIDGDGRSN